MQNQRTVLETKIILDKFKLRSYQKPMVEALKKGIRKILAVWPRRAGKDLVSWTWMIRAALEKKGIYYYIFPTYSQSRKALFEGMTNDGTNFLSYIPKELVSAINSAEMKITLINGSLIRFVGSMDYNKLMGTNPSACVISEYGLSDPMALQYIRPILTANGGWLIVNSTPRGRNHLHTLAEIAAKSDDWFYSKLTIDDTQHISVEEIRKQIESGEVSESLARQEFWTSFNEGAQGAFYNRELNRLLLEERICSVSYEPQFPVHCSFDIGLDTTAICFFQVIGTNVHFIDYYENSNLPLDHYIGVVKNKPYSLWGKFIFPHDMANREFTSGVSRIDTARNMGITVTLAPNLSIDDGIEATRCLLAKSWIDSRNCKRLIKCLENYMQEFNEKSQMYTGKAVHDQFSHGADSLRMAAVSIKRLYPSTSPEELDKRFLEACAGPQAHIPAFFRDNDQNQY